MERLRDDDAGSNLQGPIVDDDHAFRIDRLGQESLPQLPGLLRPGRELIEIGVVGTIHPGGCAAGQPQQVSTVRDDEVVEGGLDAAVGAGRRRRELFLLEIPAERQQLPGRPAVVAVRLEQGTAHAGSLRRAPLMLAPSVGVFDMATIIGAPARRDNRFPAVRRPRPAPAQAPSVLQPPGPTTAASELINRSASCLALVTA
jgi:hypothetical protein